MSIIYYVFYFLFFVIVNPVSDASANAIVPIADGSPVFADLADFVLVVFTVLLLSLFSVLFSTLFASSFLLFSTFSGYSQI